MNISKSEGWFFLLQGRGFELLHGGRTCFHRGLSWYFAVILNEHPDINPNQTSVLWWHVLHLNMGGTQFQSFILSWFHFIVFYRGIGSKTLRLTCELGVFQGFRTRRARIATERFQDIVLKSRISRQSWLIFSLQTIQLISRRQFCVYLFILESCIKTLFFSTFSSRTGGG